ncbi:hypothetical protein [Phytoactinopolyspora endophytica]|uniref:hypothetical protein n=1 Tax=Phytoactinopolyspora endophytica TaxID=1642495 RepID=UPI00101B5B99|nr:hypothetical protein [Phytoactinopolyspora endophytica]
MYRPVQAPDDYELALLGVDVEHGDEPAQRIVTVVAGDGSRVVLAWDAWSNSATVRWHIGNHERLVMELETITEITIREESDHVRFRLRSEVGGKDDTLVGELVVLVGSEVSVSDTVLRT